MTFVAGRSAAARTLLLAGLAATLAGCGTETQPEPPTPEGAALELFRLAREVDRGDERLAAWFELPEDEGRRAALHDALDALAVADQPRVDRVETLEGLDRVVVDLTAALPSGGEASYSAQLEPGADDRWIVRWFCGPGVEWPRARRPRGEGLSSSASPAGSG